MAGALRRYWENQYAGVVGDFSRKVEKYPLTATQEEWDKLGTGARAEYCTLAAYLVVYPSAKQADYDAVVAAARGEDKQAAEAAVATLGACAVFADYKLAREQVIRTTLTKIKQTYADVRAHMLDVAQTHMDGATKLDYDKDFDVVVAEVDAKIALVGKGK